MRGWRSFPLWLGFMTLGGSTATAMYVERQAAAPGARITVGFDNVPCAPGLAKDWGFAAVVETGGETVLFDTGGDGPTLLAPARDTRHEPDMASNTPEAPRTGSQR
jgi:hypothetical protein